MEEPLKMESLVRDREGDVWRRGRKKWTCTTAPDGRRVTQVGRLPWYALERMYGPLEVIREGR